MITVSYARTMAAYNREMNGRLYAAAGRLPDAERRRDRGAFWDSIQGTFSHLLWADIMWMSRLDGWQAPGVNLGDSAGAFPEFEPMAARRVEADAGIATWAAGLSDDWFDADLTWTSGAAGCEITMPRGLVVAHVFNHQTHHRGQVHAMLTAAGEATGATDLPLVLSR